MMEPLAGPLQIFFRIMAGTNQIPECFMIFIWRPNGSQFSSTKKLSQPQSISPVRFDTISSPARNQRRGHNNTVNIHR
jgi:hypothetical protein